MTPSAETGYNAPNAQRPTPASLSVIVLTYNASWERVRATLNSIILQKDINFELIVADDCSKDNYFDKIRDFFSRHSFTNYTLISRSENFGILKNLLEAAKVAQGDYIRGIGQGDMFFDEYALRDSYNDAVKNNSDVQVSKAVCYKAFSNPVKIIECTRSPQNVEAYKFPDMLRETYLINGDIAYGCMMLYKREILIKYFTEGLTRGVKLLEDHLIRMMVFDKRKISYFNKNIIFYEIHAGISSTNLIIFNVTSWAIHKITSNDSIILENMLLERCDSEKSDFSEKLKTATYERIERIKRYKSRQVLKKKLGIFAIPLVIIKRTLLFIRNSLNKKIMTDIKVSTDFANLCINRE